MGIKKAAYLVSGVLAAALAAVLAGCDEKEPAETDTYYTLSVGINPLGGGSVELSPSGGRYKAGVSVSVTAVPSREYGCVFSAWSGDSDSRDSLIVVSVDSNITLFAGFDCADEPPPGVFPPESVVRGSVTDARDGKEYSTVKIGNQTWLAQNLNLETDGSWCYGDNKSNCAAYGRLYAWDAAVSACEGLGGKWHLPSSAEWGELMISSMGEFVTIKDPRGNVLETVEGHDFACRRLKSKTGWKNEVVYGHNGETRPAYGPVFVKEGSGYSITAERVKSDFCPSGNGDDCHYYKLVDSVLVAGTDDYGFSAMPGGERDYFGGFGYLGHNGGWWSATEDRSGDAYYLNMYGVGDGMVEHSDDKRLGQSVRCVARDD